MRRVAGAGAIVRAAPRERRADVRAPSGAPCRSRPGAPRSALYWPRPGAANLDRDRRVSPLRRTRIEGLPPGLLPRLRRGTPEARAEFFRLYAPRAREILFLQGMCDDVDDGVQEVFVKVFRATLPREETFLGWFYQVIVNTGRDLGRRRRSRLRLLRRLTDTAPADVAPAPEPPAGDRRLRDALQALAPEFREAVALRFFADLSLDEIARCQGVPTGTVKSRLHTALARLRTALTAPAGSGEAGRSSEGTSPGDSGHMATEVPQPVSDRNDSQRAAFDDDRLLDFALGLEDDPELAAALSVSARLRERLADLKSDLAAIETELRGAIPPIDESYAAPDAARWPRLQRSFGDDEAVRRRPRRGRRLTAALVAAALALAIVIGVAAILPRGQSSPSTASHASSKSAESVPAPAGAVGAASGQSAQGGAFAAPGGARTAPPPPRSAGAARAARWRSRRPRIATSPWCAPAP